MSPYDRVAQLELVLTLRDRRHRQLRKLTLGAVLLGSIVLTAAGLVTLQT